MLNERNTGLQWPGYYPRNCPPEEAEVASGTFYRLVRKHVVQVEDFIPLYLEKPDNFDNRSIREVCQGCGVSVVKDLQDLARLKNSSGKMRKRLIAEGKLKPTLGMIKHTPSRNYKSHHTWWIPTGKKPWLAFIVIDDQTNRQ